jgi:RimJ/RimL family protein N-acetyltransferase
MCCAGSQTADLLIWFKPCFPFQIWLAGPVKSDFDEEASVGEGRFIDFKCPYCGHALSFREDCAGRIQECVNCLEVVVMPTDGSEVGRTLPLPLQTPRLCLRRLHPDDWHDLLELWAHPELFPEEDREPKDEEQIVRWLQDDEKAKLTQPNQALCLGIVLQNSRLIGLLSLCYLDADHLQAGITIELNRKFHGQGYATEAIRAALEFCFAGTGSRRVVASCGSRNAAARRLFERAGLRFEGEFVEDRMAKGDWVNTVFYALLSREFSAAAETAPPGNKVK